MLRRGYVPRTERDAVSLVGISENDVRMIASTLSQDADEREFRDSVIDLKGDLQNTPYLDGSPRAAVSFVQPCDIAYFNQVKASIRKGNPDLSASVFISARLAFKLVDNIVFAVESRLGHIAVYWPGSQRWHWLESGKRHRAAPREFAAFLKETRCSALPERRRQKRISRRDRFAIHTGGGVVILEGEDAE